jgi:hypothetical protein
VINRHEAKTDRMVFAPMSVRPIIYTRPATAPTAGGFTISQIGAIMGNARRDPPDKIAFAEMRCRGARRSIAVTNIGGHRF